jgi:hypothetical protein
LPKSITVYYAGTKKSLNRDYNNTEVNLEEPCQRVLETKKKRRRALPKSIRNKEETKKIPAKEYYKTQRKTKKSPNQRVLLNTEENKEEPCQRVL